MPEAEGLVKQDLGRRLVAVMFTDMVGYTALFQADERLAMDKHDRYTRAIDRHHEAFGGTIVQRLGDGSMSMFPGALVAVHEIVDAAAQLSAQEPDRWFDLGVGVHAGEAVETAEGFIGTAVNVAARVCAAARPGEVLVTSTVRASRRRASPPASSLVAGGA